MSSTLLTSLMWKLFKANLDDVGFEVIKKKEHFNSLFLAALLSDWDVLATVAYTAGCHSCFTLVHEHHCLGFYPGFCDKMLWPKPTQKSKVLF